MGILTTMISTVLLSILCRTMLELDDNQTFLQCLIDNSHPSHPISSSIYTPQSSSYASVLESYIRNLRFNESFTPKPFLILTPTHESHIQAAVTCAKTHGLQMKIRSGGHDYEGLSYTSDVPFFLLDMFNLRSVDVDIENETAWVQSGATLGEVFYRIAEKSRTHGFPAGVCPTVGVGGHVSGAGYGNMMRKYGVSADNVDDAIVVDADGRVLDRKSMGEDLFWAIRGGGGASFAVIVAYKIKLVRVPETVTVFQVERTLEDEATEIVDQWQHVAYDLPEELFIRVMFDVVTGKGGEKTVRASFISLFLGDSDSLISIMNQMFPMLGLSKSDCIETSWVKSVLFWSDIPLETDIEVLLHRVPRTLDYLKRKSDYVREPIPKAGLEAIWKKMMELEAPRMFFNPYGGKMAEIASEEIPFPHRAGNLWKIQYLCNWKESGTEAANRYIDLTRELHEFMTPFVSKNPRRAFLNYRDADLGSNYNGEGLYEETKVNGMKWFMGNFERLVKIKTEVDPGNFFRYEQSIPVLPYQHCRNVFEASRHFGSCWFISTESPPIISIW